MLGQYPFADKNRWVPLSSGEEGEFLFKTEYREYLASSDWQERRRDFLLENSRCAKCEIPRWLAEIAYDQDLNVHHLSYANLGDEDWDDLQALCRRCHEMEKFGRSDLRAPKTAICDWCSAKHWNPYDSLCARCRAERDMRTFCQLCRQCRTIPQFGVENQNYCEFCNELMIGNPNALWDLCSSVIPETKGVTMVDIALIGIMARLGTDNLLGCLVNFEEAANKYREEKKMQYERNLENEIPF